MRCIHECRQNNHIYISLRKWMLVTLDLGLMPTLIQYGLILIWWAVSEWIWNLESCKTQRRVSHPWGLGKWLSVKCLLSKSEDLGLDLHLPSEAGCGCMCLLAITSLANWWPSWFNDMFFLKIQDGMIGEYTRLRPLASTHLHTCVYTLEAYTDMYRLIHPPSTYTC